MNIYLYSFFLYCKYVFIVIYIYSYNDYKIIKCINICIIVLQLAIDKQYAVYCIIIQKGDSMIKVNVINTDVSSLTI